MTFDRDNREWLIPDRDVRDWQYADMLSLGLAEIPLADVPECVKQFLDAEEISDVNGYAAVDTERKVVARLYFHAHREMELVIDEEEGKELYHHLQAHADPVAWVAFEDENRRYL